MTEFMIQNIQLGMSTDEFERQYGVEITASERTDLSGVINELSMAVASLTSLRSQLGVDGVRGVVAYQPEYILRSSPNPDQVKRYNDDQTQIVAQRAVNVQRGLELVPIQESEEKFAYLPSLFDDYGVDVDFSETTFHEACGEWAGKPREFWARQSFAERLVAMGGLLNATGSKLYIEDALRPVGVQEGLFKRRIAWTKNDHPDWSEDEVVLEAMSKTAVKPRLASHKAGAAIDARIKDIASGEILDFGHNYPDGGALVYPKTTFVDKTQWLNRQRFQIAAELSGLTLYVGEDWHVSYGDNLASLDANGVVDPRYVAQYGPIKEFDRQTGEILSYYSKDELDTIFDF